MLELSVGTGKGPDEITVHGTLLLEYKSCCEGISRFDEICFRIRTWNATATATLGAATLASATASKNADTILLIAMIMNALFWYLDAMQKSLQLNFIKRSRTLEDMISAVAMEKAEALADYKGMELGHMFAEQHASHMFEGLRNVWQQSIAPFYAFPMVACVCGIIFF